MDPPAASNRNTNPSMSRINTNLNTNPTSLATDPLTLAIKAAQEKRINETRDFFEQLITDYPTCGRFWKIYIEQELKYRNFERVEKLFQRSVIKVLNVELWKCYLNYVRDIKAKMPNHKEKTAQAYDFALDKIGIDVSSYSVWVDYINFLKSVEAVGTFAENQKITAIRKVYQKGVMNPMSNVEQLWKDYCAFENQINPLIAKRMIDERSREFMIVRKISKEYENVTKHLDRNSPCMLPQGTQEELKQKSFWKKYIEWEKANPLKSEDPSIVAKRVMYAYEQCLLYLGTHPDIHYEAANYLQQMSLLMAEKCDAMMSRHYANECTNLYEKAINSFMKHNMLIYFAYCDYEEIRLNYNKVKEIYDKLLSISEVDPSLCYIQYMRFLRRIEGIRSARLIFKRAREDKRISYHVYVAAACMEYFCTKDKKIANKIFEYGCKLFGHIPEYLLSYYEFLTHLNDDETIRIFFDDVLNGEQLPKEKAGEIWSAWLDFENNAGDLSSISKVMRLREEFYDDINQMQENQTVLLIDRFKYMNLYPCSEKELKMLGYNDLIHNYAQFTSNLTNQSQLSQEDKFESKTSETIQSLNPFTNRSNIKRPHLPIPDTSKMYPFKPNRGSANGLTPVPCGNSLILFPSVISDVLKRLPPPTCFNGPYVSIEDFLKKFNSISLPNDFQSFYNKYLAKVDSSFKQPTIAGGSTDKSLLKRSNQESNDTKEKDTNNDLNNNNNGEASQRQHKKLIK